MDNDTSETVTAVWDEGTGRWHLQGREQATAQAANVFGNGNFEPVGADSDKRIVFEAEVKFCFGAGADDDPTDYGEAFQFRLLQWGIRSERAVSTVLLDWQDFSGDDPPGEEYGWDTLLRLAVARVRRVRSEREPFEPVLVGAAVNLKPNSHSGRP